MVAFPSTDSPRIDSAFGPLRRCANYVHEGVCNWLLADGATDAGPTGVEPTHAGETDELCRACRLNHVIPNLEEPKNRSLWLEVERAKRRLIYSLDALGLPVLAKSDDPERGLSFDIKQSSPEERVLTGHADGLITLNLSEADAAERERMRLAMQERYRTLLGHFRHEIGHYYWDRLVADAGQHEAFRALFGDERADYAAALKAHYATAPHSGYAERFISDYAASHPWEDFAETFAHYLHLVDTLETAEQYGFASASPAAADFEDLMSEWYQLTIALNALNRSMGQPDAYPFAITPIVKLKLAFVHELVHASRGSVASEAPAAAQ